MEEKEAESVFTAREVGAGKDQSSEEERDFEFDEETLWERWDGFALG